jgi:hypothetical protein
LQFSLPSWSEVLPFLRLRLIFFLFFSYLFLLFFPGQLGVQQFQLGVSLLTFDGGLETATQGVHCYGGEHLAGTFFFTHAHVNPVQALVHADTQARQDFLLGYFQGFGVPLPATSQQFRLRTADQFSNVFGVDW